MHILIIALVLIGACTVLRYALPLVGLLLWAAGAGVVWLWDRMKDYGARRD